MPIGITPKLNPVPPGNIYNMTLTVITAPIAEPVDLADVKDALRIDHDDDDVRITGLIRSAREFAQAYTGLTLMDTTVELSMDRWPGTEFKLGVWPLQSIDSVKYDDTASPVAEQTLVVNTDYYADTTLVDGRVRTISGWPSVAVKPNPIRIRMTAGYADVDDVPEQIKDAIKAYCIFLYDCDSSMEKVARQLLWPQRKI